MILRVLKKMHINLHIYIQFVCYLDFRNLKKDTENLFSSCDKIKFRKKIYFSHFSHNFSKKLT